MTTGSWAVVCVNICIHSLRNDLKKEKLGIEQTKGKTNEPQKSSGVFAAKPSEIINTMIEINFTQ